MEILVIKGNPKNYEEALKETFHVLYKNGNVKKSFLDACIEREKKFPTGLPTEIKVAIPHTDPVHVISTAICVLRLKEPVKFREMGNPENEVNAQFIFNMALKDNKTQLPMLQSILKIAQNGDYLRKLYKKSPEVIQDEVYNILSKTIDNSLNL